jgi:hypothetical protein
MINVMTAAIIPTTKYKYFIISSILISISYRRQNYPDCAHCDKGDKSDNKSYDKKI